ncbi:MAG: ArnT family glycosyltransferase [Bacteroidota bacterium]
MMNPIDFSISAKAFRLILAGIVMVYLLNLRLDVMEVDAAQYASISHEMLTTKSFLQVHHRGEDYLDKPPLLFWCSAISMSIFGSSAFAYKLPGFFSLLITLFSLYQFCLLWYNEQTARRAVLILGTCQAWFLMSNDVKMEGLLSAGIMFAIWQGSVFFHRKSLTSVILFSLGISAALLTKGPIGFVLPIMALGFHLWMKKQVKIIMHPRVLLFFPMVFLLLLPMCIGLYLQFDLHPEKEVYGLKGPSGLEFFFYTQSFGRLTGDIYWSNHSPWYFVLRRMGWDFAPWCFLFWPIFLRIILKKNLFFHQTEYITMALFSVGIIGFSISNYKLPHYVFPLFPACSVLIAHHAEHLVGKNGMRFFLLYLLVIFLVMPPLALLRSYDADALPWMLYAVVLFSCLYMVYQKKWLYQTLFVSLLGFGLIMSVWFYPSLLVYQSSSLAGKYLKKKRQTGEKVFLLAASGHALDFYSQTLSKTLKDANSGDWLYASSACGDSLLAMGNWTLRLNMPDFPVSRLKARFLLDKERDKTLQHRYLLQKK